MAATTEDRVDDENDSDEDEDYNPELEKDKDNEDEDNDDPMEDVEVVEETSVLAPSQKKAVDEAFQELFGYQWGTSFQLGGRTRGRRSMISVDDKKERLLVQVLGSARAALILKTGGSMIRARRPKRQAAALAKWTKSATATAAAAGSSESATVAFTQKQKPQYETKLFAGQKIQVAVAPSSQTTTSSKAASGTGIDSVLQQIAGPSKITTVAKTSADWDSFKTDTGIESELEKKAQGKDAFLVKQDFLNRVDSRKFDIERGERDRERSKRGK